MAEANEFLRALEARGLSTDTLRAYAFDLVALYRWLRVRIVEPKKYPANPRATL